MNKKEYDFYQKLRKRIERWIQTEKGQHYRWAEYILAAPDLFHLLVKLSLEKEIPAADRGKLLAAIAYFILPVDIIPEALFGPVGFADDVALAAYVLNSLVNHVDPELVRKHWAGQEDVLDLLRRILRVTDEMVGRGLWSKVKKVIHERR